MKEGTMANVAAVRAYLEWQSEMGTEEVILPYPLIRKPSPSAMAPGRTADSAGAPERGANLTQALQPAETPSGRELPEIAPANLFASLSMALEQAAGPKPTGFGPLSGTASTAAGRAPEADALPVFPGPEEFWRYLEANPHIVLGEGPSGAAATAKSGTAVTRVVRGTGPSNPPLALVGFEPSEADEAEGKAFRGEAGALLEKMMKAIRLDAGALYFGNLIKVRVAGKAWSRRELARLVPLLHAELGLAGAPMVLLLGQECAQTVLKTGKTLEELRQETHRLEGREFFVTYHPQELLRKEELKRKAWEDLQWLQRRMAEAQARP